MECLELSSTGVGNGKFRTLAQRPHYHLWQIALNKRESEVYFWGGQEGLLIGTALEVMVGVGNLKGLM